MDDEGNEILSYIEGSVGNYPLDESWLEDPRLLQAARLLRSLHDTTASLSVPDDAIWRFPYHCAGPHEVIVHNDFATYNTVVKDGVIVGIIDFDYCCPGTRAWDVAHTLFRWVPLIDDEYGRAVGQRRIERARMFCKVYGIAWDQHMLDTIIHMLDTIIRRVTLLRDWDPTMPFDSTENVRRNPHAEVYAKTLEYLSDLRESGFLRSASG